jgi:transposase InsO family protein
MVRSRYRLFDQPFRQLLGHRGDGEFLLVVEDRANRRKLYRSRDEAKTDVFDYIERFYNPERRRSTIGYTSPHGVREAGWID